MILISFRTFQDKISNSPKFKDFPGHSRTKFKFQDFPGQWAPCITIITGEHSRCTRSYNLKRDQGFDSFPCVFNVVPICFKIFIRISLFTFLRQSGKHVSVVFVFNVSFLFQYRMLCINERSNLYFTDIYFCKPKAIQGLDLNLNLHLSILLRGAQVSNKYLFYICLDRIINIQFINFQ